MRHAKPISHLLGIHRLSASACMITMQVDFIDHEPMELGVDAAALMVLGLMSAKGAMVHGGHGMILDGWTERAILRQKFLLACDAYLSHAAMYHQEKQR